MKTLYPSIEPYATHYHLDGRHRIYFEECGNPKGIPILFLHGGPGSGCKSYHRSFFHPERYRIILFDQRGAGRSAPLGELSENTTADLLHDIEAIRRTLNIEQWLLFGGSWGATLALLYAEDHPSKVMGLILRGLFLARQRDIDWLVGDRGARCLYPDQWDRLATILPKEECDPLSVLYQQLTSHDELAQRRAARQWELWNTQVVLGREIDPIKLNEPVPIETVYQARMELHYAAHRYFITENKIVDECEKIAHVPISILHGRRDLVCPVDSAWTLHRRLPESQLKILPDAGHIAQEDSMIDALVSATDYFAELFLT